MSVHAIVPIKSLARGKLRLSGVLMDHERHRLIKTMFTHVLSIVRRVPEIALVSVLTDDRSLVPPGCFHIRDPGTGLNAAVSHAAGVVAAAGASTAMIVSADLPFVMVEDIELLIDAGNRYDVVVGMDAAGSGTNALLISPPSLIQPRFGANSYFAHIDAARAIGAKVHSIQRQTLGRDIDEPSHLEAVISAGQPAYSFLGRALQEVS